MTQTLNRKASAQRRQSTRPASRTRAGDRPRLTRGYTLVVLAMAYAATIALLVVTVGFTSLARTGTGVKGHSTAKSAPGGQSQGVAGPIIKIQASHLGNLVVTVKADVTMNKGDALMKAKVVLYTDMIEMPQMHAKGPIPMPESPKQPGRYQVNTTVPMVGDFSFRVVVQSPVSGEKTINYSVGTVGQNGAPQQPPNGGKP